jgi:ferrous iron transport protein B
MGASDPHGPERAAATVVLALAGQPNVGKSTVFNLLTGLSQHVGNWPGKTVERKEGTLLRNGMRLRIVDLPGTYGLSAHSAEERIARDFLIRQRPDVVMMIADASALERNLYLLAELLILPVPVVLGLNMMDMARAQGLEIEPHVLEAALGLPVVPLVASKNQGVAELLAAAQDLVRAFTCFQPNRPEIAESHRKVLAQVRALLAGWIPPPFTEDWMAIKLLEGDAEVTDYVRDWLPDGVWASVHELLRAHEDAVLDIASGRYEWIARMVRAAVTRPRLGQITLTDRLDRVAVHPLGGLLLLFSVFGAVFWLTFTLAVPLQHWLDRQVIERLRAALATALGEAPSWLVHLLADGVLGGVGLVATFVPVLVVFFAALAFLEDTGYLVRAAYVMDRFMHLLGLHGKSFLPLFLGFGCNVPAVMGARVIESRGGRLLTILLAPLVPCSARLVVLTLIAAALFGERGALVSWAFVGLNLLVLAAVGIVLSRTLFRGEHAAFIMELPLYHAPNLRTIALFVWNNTWAFLRKAGTVILAASVVIWALSSFPGPGIEHSYLARFGRGLAPLGGLMGLDWRMLVALLTSLVAKENAIATLSILFEAQGEHDGFMEVMAASVSPASALAFITVTMLFIPCVATVAVMYQETRSWRWTLFDVGLLLVVAFAAGAGAYHVAAWLGLGGK